MDLGTPQSYLTLQRGADVYSSDEQVVGKVEHVLADDAEDVFDGIVIDLHVGPGGMHFADADHVTAIGEKGCALDLPADQCDQLPKPSENPAVLEAHSLDSSLHAKLRRAWDLISGRY